MMDDGKSKNYNSVLVSLVTEMLYENHNKEISRAECYQTIVEELSINVDQDLFFKILEKNKSFEHTPVAEDVLIKLSSKKFQEVDERVQNFSIGHHIEEFITNNSLDSKLIDSTRNLLYQAIYENINSFTIQNVTSLLPISTQEKYNKTEINTFNLFLEDKSHSKNIALFNVFLKAVEFAILTSGKGVKEFSKDLFKGKAYFLDANVIFRMLGVGGDERKESVLKLVDACHHQGIVFTYSSETYREFKRKLTASVAEMNNAASANSMEILEDLYFENEERFNNSFITHYASLRATKKVRSPDQYETHLLAEFKVLSKKYKIDQDGTNSLKPSQIEAWTKKLFKKKKDLNKYSRYTKTAAKVDATNVLLVKTLRGSNDHNYSDIKSFYLTTDRTLNSILASENENKIAETILPSQLFILHNSLYDKEEELDYDSFNKFLKRRTTEFNYSGSEVLNYIDEIRNYTSDTENIKEVIKAYSDKKYETALLDVDSEPEYKSIKEFAESRLDKKLKKVSVGDEKYIATLKAATTKFPVYLNRSKLIIRVLDVILALALIPISVLIIKTSTDNFYIILSGVLVVELLKFLISSRSGIFEKWNLKLFMQQVKRSAYYKMTKDVHDDFVNEANEFIKQNSTKIWN